MLHVACSMYGVGVSRGVENENTNGKEEIKEGDTLNTMAGEGNIVTNVKEKKKGTETKDAHQTRKRTNRKRNRQI